MEVYSEGDQIVLQQGERHRLIGLEDLRCSRNMATYRC